MNVLHCDEPVISGGSIGALGEGACGKVCLIPAVVGLLRPERFMCVSMKDRSCLHAAEYISLLSVIHDIISHNFLKPLNRYYTYIRIA